MYVNLRAYIALKHVGDALRGGILYKQKLTKPRLLRRVSTSVLFKTRLFQVYIMTSFLIILVCVDQWFSNWGPQSFWGSRDNFLGTAKHLPKKSTRRS